MHVLVQVEGNAETDLISGLDSVAASVERGETTRTAEAPDKSGRYTYTIYKSNPPFTFSLIEKEKQDLLANITKLTSDNKALSDKIAALEKEISIYKTAKPVETAVEPKTDTGDDTGYLKEPPVKATSAPAKPARKASVY
jgi:hypothetical protein